MPTIFDSPQKGQKAYSLPKAPPPIAAITPPHNLLRASPPPLPEKCELEITRHFSTLARKNFSIDTHFYPLGSCTMKLNPRICEKAAAITAFASTHPLADESLIQGSLHILHALIEELIAITGMDDGTLAPCAGAQGEFVGLQMIRAHHKSRGESSRNEVIIPDSAHGTNAATATMAGLKVLPLRSTPNGDIDIAHLCTLISPHTAALMLTNPNTLGIFCPSAQHAANIVHDAGGLLYYDGANLNAILNIIRPGDMGFDVMHINLHKTFSTPHGGGGPGSGPVLCKAPLAPYLPTPRITKAPKGYTTTTPPTSIGAISTFFGNSATALRAYLYIKLHGKAGLRNIAHNAVLNANYLKEKLAPHLTIPFPGRCMHEFVVQADRYLSSNIKALDIAKRLLDYQIHAPTIYFPLTIKECMLIEPTETESKATLDTFVDTLVHILKEAATTPHLLTSAPHTLPVGRLDEVLAARTPRFTAGESAAAGEGAALPCTPPGKGPGALCKPQA